MYTSMQQLTEYSPGFSLEETEDGWQFRIILVATMKANEKTEPEAIGAVRDKHTQNFRTLAQRYHFSCKC